MAVEIGALDIPAQLKSEGLAVLADQGPGNVAGKGAIKDHAFGLAEVSLADDDEAGTRARERPACGNTAARQGSGGEADASQSLTRRRYDSIKLK